MTLATPAGETAPGPSVPRRWRPRRLDVVLVVVGTIMAIATGAEIASIYQLRGRGPEDARALAAYTARLTPGARYGLAKVSSAIKGFDVICADLRRGGKPYYRQCVVVRRQGPIRQRVVGGYRRPPRAFEAKSDHYACWGRALTLHLCLPGWLEPGPGGGPPLPLRAFR
ncbi:MAG: hypothetical protein E6G30_05405 [Actinobacteria bacterium]|jgi:hypothetical protein|nr:MAG: hypothetical protein E6G30_05405 [Actinomycetota bacterium]